VNSIERACTVAGCPAIGELPELVRYRAKLVQLRCGLKAQVHAVMAKGCRTWRDNYDRTATTKFIAPSVGRACETETVSDAAWAVVLVVCVIVALGGFVTGIRLVRRVRAESEEANAERDQ
jgi:hypothetical protein